MGSVTIKSDDDFELRPDDAKKEESGLRFKCSKQAASPG